MHYVFISYSFLALIVLARPSQGTDDQIINLFPNLKFRSLDLLSPSNASIQDLNTSSRRGLNIQCDGAKYGFNPSLSDCQVARGYIVPESEQLVFGERHTGLPQDIFPLPWVIMGGTLKAVKENLI